MREEGFATHLGDIEGVTPERVSVELDEYRVDPDERDPDDVMDDAAHVLQRGRLSSGWRVAVFRDPDDAVVGLLFVEDWRHMCFPPEVERDEYDDHIAERTRERKERLASEYGFDADEWEVLVDRYSSAHGPELGQTQFATRP